jgi:hypothetical protein
VYRRDWKAVTKNNSSDSHVNCPPAHNSGFALWGKSYKLLFAFLSVAFGVLVANNN